MSRIAGFVNYKKELQNKEEVLNKMLQTIKKHSSNEDGIYLNSKIALGDRQLNEQLYVEKYLEGEYVITYDGKIYNNKELKEKLEKEGFSFITRNDTEVILKAYILYGKDVVKHLNGAFAFAIWNTKTKELFLARDHLGVKPLFYCQIDGGVVFASEVKQIFEYPEIEKIIDKQGICELIGLGPAHTLGLTVYKDIFELKPGNIAIYNESGMHTEEYWKLETKPHKDDFEQTCKKTKLLIEDSIAKQIIDDRPICTFLSGGLDSSIITEYASKNLKENGYPPLDTYSVDYVDNDKNFVKSDFQPDSDSYYIELMNNKTYTKNHKIILDTPELAEYLEQAMIARDVPGMADVDSSFFLLCKEVEKEKKISIMGECADEIFAGYPWFFREDCLNSNTFPWSSAITERQKLLNPNLAKEIDLREYIDNRYNETISKVKILESDSYETAEKRKISYLTMTWFMPTLLDRGDRMSTANGFEIRIPFCDYRIAEYMYNVPWDMKAYKGREKGLLRYIMKDILPEEIVNRKKSPYPKTHNPEYLKKVKEILTSIMKNNDSPINYLLNRDYIIDIINTEGESFTKPWFGQLMTLPQLMAYLCQVNMWLEKYNPKVVIGDGAF